jgi:hypothetical protein
MDFAAKEGANGSFSSRASPCEPAVSGKFAPKSPTLRRQEPSSTHTRDSGVPPGPGREAKFGFARPGPQTQKNAPKHQTKPKWAEPGPRATLSNMPLVNTFLLLPVSVQLERRRCGAREELGRWIPCATWWSRFGRCKSAHLYSMVFS